MDTPARFEVRKDSVHSYYGVFDVKASTWHEGTYDDATYAAGIPMWRTRARAAEVAADANRESVSVFVVEHYTEEMTTEIYGVAANLAAAQRLGEKCFGPHDAWGSERDWTIDWRALPVDTDQAGHPVQSWVAHQPAVTGRGSYLFIQFGGAE